MSAPGDLAVSRTVVGEDVAERLLNLPDQEVVLIDHAGP